MASTVAMTYPTVTAVARGFDAQAAMLKVIMLAITAAVRAMQAACFMAPMVVEKLEQYLENIQKANDKLVKDCEFYSKNLDKAVNDHKTGQYDAGSYFTQGDSLGG